MDISKIASSAYGLQDYIGGTHRTGGIEASDFSRALDTATENLKQQDQGEPYRIFVRSGQTPELEKYKEDWMRPVENFML